MAKQTKAKASSEAKLKAKEEEQVQSAQSDPSQVPVAVAKAKASKPGGRTPLALTLGKDQANLAYYEAVQEDIRKIEMHFGRNFAHEPAMAIAAANCEGEGGIQEPCALCEFFTWGVSAEFSLMLLLYYYIFNFCCLYMICSFPGALEQKCRGESFE